MIYFFQNYLDVQRQHLKCSRRCFRMHRWLWGARLACLMSPGSRWFATPPEQGFDKQPVWWSSSDVQACTLPFSVREAHSIHTYFKFSIIVFQRKLRAQQVAPQANREQQLDVAPRRLVHKFMPKLHWNRHVQWSIPCGRELLIAVWLATKRNATPAWHVFRGMLPDVLASSVRRERSRARTWVLTTIASNASERRQIRISRLDLQPRALVRYMLHRASASCSTHPLSSGTACARTCSGQRTRTLHPLRWCPLA